MTLTANNRLGTYSGRFMYGSKTLYVSQSTATGLYRVVRPRENFTCCRSVALSYIRRDAAASEGGRRKPFSFKSALPHGVRRPSDEDGSSLSVLLMNFMGVILLCLGIAALTVLPIIIYRLCRP